MAKFSIHKTSNYTTIDNEIFKNNNMSLKARGLLITMLSLPESWDYSVNGLCAIIKDGKDSIRSGLDELESLGYLVRTRVRDTEGKLRDVVYDVYEKPESGKPKLENPILDNPPQLSTYFIKEKNNKKNTSFPSGNMRVVEHDSLESVISRVKVLASNNFGLESYLINNLVDIFTYYFNKFHDYFIGYHPMISDDSLCKIIDKLISGSDKFEDLIYDTENYHLIIDKHFKTNYGMDIDYHMQHFATEGVLNKLSFQELY